MRSIFARTTHTHTTHSRHSSLLISARARASSHHSFAAYMVCQCDRRNCLIVFLSFFFFVVVCFILQASACGHTFDWLESRSACARRCDPWMRAARHRKCVRVSFHSMRAEPTSRPHMYISRSDLHCHRRPTKTAAATATTTTHSTKWNRRHRIKCRIKYESFECVPAKWQTVTTRTCMIFNLSIVFETAPDDSGDGGGHARVRLDELETGGLAQPKCVVIGGNIKIGRNGHKTMSHFDCDRDPRHRHTLFRRCDFNYCTALSTATFNCFI